LKTLPILTLALFALPLSAQAWDLRMEAPFAQGQDLPLTAIGGVATSGSLDTGHGVILTVSHRIQRLGPVLKFEWLAEYSHLQAGGQIQQGQASSDSKLRQAGLGAGINAQFWVPFTGLAGELALIERVQNYRYAGAGAAEDHTLARPWLRAGWRWHLPLPGIDPYLALSYQVPFNKDSPVHLGSASSLGDYLGAQGTGQEFNKMWTLGLGVSF